MRVLAISGSLQKKSGNLELLRIAAASAPEGVEVVLFDGIRALPLFDPDLEDGIEAPEPVRTWREALRGSDAVLIASPEYGHSLPGSLKNAVDWIVGSGDLWHKPVAITAAVPTPERGLLGLGALAQTLRAVDARVVGARSITRGPSFEREIAALLAELVSLARTPA